MYVSLSLSLSIYIHTHIHDVIIITCPKADLRRASAKPLAPSRLEPAKAGEAACDLEVTYDYKYNVCV